MLTRQDNWRVRPRLSAPGDLFQIFRWQCGTQNVSQNQELDIKHYRDMIGRGKVSKLQLRSLWPAVIAAIGILKRFVLILRRVFVPKCILTDSYEIYPELRVLRSCQDGQPEISTPAILHRNRGQSPKIIIISTFASKLAKGWYSDEC